MVLQKQQDPIGAAIYDYHQRGIADILKVLSPEFDEDVIPVDILFRDESKLLPMETVALQNCYGKVLDIGAGAGCHSLILQKHHLNVTAIDISPLSIEVIKDRGVKDARNVDFFEDTFVGSYDVLLLLMNGTGIIGRIKRMPSFFKKAKMLLKPSGCILLDSSDLCYIYEDENGIIDLTGVKGYYGEVTYQMKYKKILGPEFPWLYLDFTTLEQISRENGFKAECLQKGISNDYLAKLTLI